MRKPAKIVISVVLLAGLGACFHYYFWAPPRVLRHSPANELKAAGRHADLVRWCDAQGFPDLRDARIVSLSSKQRVRGCGTGWKEPIDAEFLLQSRPDGWLVFSPNSPWAWSGSDEPLGMLDYPSRDWDLWTPYAYTEDELARYATAVLQALEYRGDAKGAPVTIPRGVRLHAVVVARALLRRGSAELATRVFDAIEAHAQRHAPGRPLRDLLDIELYGDVLAPPFGDNPPLSLADAERRLNDVRRRLAERAATPEWQRRCADAAIVFIESEYRSSGDASEHLLRVAQACHGQYPSDGELGNLAQTLRRMRDEATQVPRDGIDAAIRALRTVDDTISYLRGPDGMLREPGGLLLRQGYAAIPALITALEDDSLTRIIRGDAHRLRCARVADLALPIIEEIAHQRFIPDPRPNILPPATRNAAFEAARAWWRTEGEPASKTLLARIEAGGRGVPELFEELLSKRPAQAASELHRVIDACASADDRRRVLRILARATAIDELTALRGAAQACEEPESRVIVAARLAWRGFSAEAQPLLIDELVRLRSAVVTGSALDATALQLIVGAAMIADAPAALDPLPELFASLATGDRLELLKVLGGEVPFVLTLLSDQRGVRRPKLSGPMIAAFEKALGAALEDTSETTPANVIAKWSPERVRTAAARALAKLLPEHYREEATLLPRELLAWEEHVRVVWLARQRGEAPPAEAALPAASDGAAPQITALVDEYVTRPANRDTLASDLISQHGLSALRLVRDRISAGALPNEARDALQVLALDLGWIVRDTLLPEERLPDELNAAFSSLRGRPFSPPAMQTVIEAAYRSIPDNKTGFVFEAASRGDERGGTVRFRWSTTPIPIPQGMWRWHLSPTAAPQKAPNGMRADTEVRTPSFAREVAEAIANSRAPAARADGKIVFYTHVGR